MTTIDVIKRILKRANNTDQTHSGAGSLAVLSILQYQKRMMTDGSQGSHVSKQVFAFTSPYSRILEMSLEKVSSFYFHFLTISSFLDSYNCFGKS